MRCGLSPRCARGICCIRGLGRGSASQAKWEAEKQPIQRRGAELLPRTVGNLTRMPPRMGGGPEGTPPGRPRYGASTKNQRGLRRCFRRENQKQDRRRGSIPLVARRARNRAEGGNLASGGIPLAGAGGVLQFGPLAVDALRNGVLDVHFAFPRANSG